jgi:hypothetical protein
LAAGFFEVFTPCLLAVLKGKLSHEATRRTTSPSMFIEVSNPCYRPFGVRTTLKRGDRQGGDCSDKKA